MRELPKLSTRKGKKISTTNRNELILKAKCIPAFHLRPEHLFRGCSEVGRSSIVFPLRAPSSLANNTQKFPRYFAQFITVIYCLTRFLRGIVVFPFQAFRPLEAKKKMEKLFFVRGCGKRRVLPRKAINCFRISKIAE